MSKWQPIPLRIGTNVRLSCELTEGTTFIEDGHPVVIHDGKRLDWMEYGETWCTSISGGAHMGGALDAAKAAKTRKRTQPTGQEVIHEMTNDELRKLNAKISAAPSREPAKYVPRSYGSVGPTREDMARREAAAMDTAAPTEWDRAVEWLAGGLKSRGPKSAKGDRQTEQNEPTIQPQAAEGVIGKAVDPESERCWPDDDERTVFEVVADMSRAGKKAEVRDLVQKVRAIEAANDEDEHAPRMTFNVPYETYAKSPSVNWSTLKQIGVSPLHYQHALNNPTKATAAMKLGTATHTAVLEPHRWADDVAVWRGKGDRRSKAYKEWFKENEGYPLYLNATEADTALAMGKAVRANPDAAALLKEGHAEVVVEWFDLMTGMWCKGRIDWLIIKNDRAIIADFKTTKSLDSREFFGQVARMGYHSQLAHYQAGVKAVTGLPCDVFIIAVENSAPYDVGVFELDEGMPDGALYVGESIRRVLLAQLAECQRLDHWPGRYERVEPLVLPVWALIGDDADEFTFAEEG